MRVSMGAGLTVLTRIPYGAPSSEAVRINPITACLLVLYADISGVPLMPAAEEVITMLPPPLSRITGAAYLIPSHTPRTLTAITRSNISTG